ncbi:MAG: bifunctional oligoribonuclease/PAP phosphatase NrnA [Verrucomicrobia bacterium]|nr:bifunctional oligoribonuclease/PAP phosphatase NrnA [Verrucomicrobiota bacterium]MCF7709093.1 bifunctional oligoribonuclease/PAP phosphatase NrnA [Verrucomicrobiota bacterium]
MKPLPKVIVRILEALKKHQVFCIVGHGRPDGDCIGSQIALTQALLQHSKTVFCWNEDPVPQKLAFLDPDSLVRPPRCDLKFDCVIALDSASLERIGKAVDCIKERRFLINIDHHPSNTKFGDINWVSPKSPSTAELVYRLLKAGNYSITPAIADCLFTGISTDTGSFQYPTTKPHTFTIAGELVKRGANLATICDEVYQSYSLSRIRLLQQVLSRFHLVNNNKVAYFWLKNSDFERTGSDVSESEGLINHIRDIEPVVVACVFEEIEPNVIRISLRSKDENLSVAEIARKFGGGGHSSAAGARIEGSPETVQKQVIKAIVEALNSFVSPEILQ